MTAESENPTPELHTPSEETLAELDRLEAATREAPEDMEAQIRLWKAVARLDAWICIKRGTPDAPQPYMLASESGPMLCIFSSATRAKESAHSTGLIPEDSPIPLMYAPLPGAVDWALSLGEYGVVGVAIDYPRLRAWCPLPNLAQLR